MCLSCCWFGYETKRPADILLLRMAFNGFRQAKCFSLYAVPLGTGAKLLISYERSKEKTQRRGEIFLWLRHSRRFHSYEATKIELLAGQHGDVTMTSPRNSNNSITATNLLKDVEKPYGADHFFERYLAPSGRAFKIQKKSARFFCQITWRLRALPMKGAYIPG